jgi:hypothetical protein
MDGGDVAWRALLPMLFMDLHEHNRIPGWTTIVNSRYVLKERQIVKHILKRLNQNLSMSLKNVKILAATISTCPVIHCHIGVDAASGLSIPW